MVKTTITLLVVTLSLFFAAAIAEIGGGYLVWSWIRNKKRLIVGLVGGVTLFIYGIIPTLQPANFGRD
jgi:small multidrug resistance family-3 protein